VKTRALKKKFKGHGGGAADDDDEHHTSSTRPGEVEFMKVIRTFF
jgi:hypothetical protein